MSEPEEEPKDYFYVWGVGIAVALATFLLTGCGESDKPTALKKLLQSGDYGSNVFLEKQIFTSDWEPVILVFGYVDNHSVCRQLIRENKILTGQGHFYRCNAIGKK